MLLYHRQEQLTPNRLLFVPCLVCVFMSVHVHMYTNEGKSQRMILDLILMGSCVCERG